MLSVQLKHLQRVDFPTINLKAECCAYQVKALDSSCTRVHYQHASTGGITHHFQNMRMSADEQIRSIPVDEFACGPVIATWITTDMSHEHLHAVAFEKAVERVDKAELMVIAVAGNSFKRLERCYLPGKIHSPAEVSCMPYFINILEEFLEFFAKHSMSVRYQSYLHP